MFITPDYTQIGLDEREIRTKGIRKMNRILDDIGYVVAFSRYMLAISTETPEALDQDTPTLGSNDLGTASVGSPPRRFFGSPSLFTLFLNDTFLFFQTYFGLGYTV